MTTDIYWIIALVTSLIVLVWIGRTDVWQEDVVGESFGFYVLSWALRLLVAGTAGAFWLAAIPIAIGASLLWMPWAAGKQKQYIKFHGKKNPDYDWKTKLHLVNKKEDEH